MTKVVESVCTLSKSRGDRLLVTHTGRFRVASVNALDKNTTVANPFAVDPKTLEVDSIDCNGETGLFGVHLPPLRPDAQQGTYEIRWAEVPEGIQAGVVFVVDR